MEILIHDHGAVLTEVPTIPRSRPVRVSEAWDSTWSGGSWTRRQSWPGQRRPGHRRASRQESSGIVGLRRCRHRPGFGGPLSVSAPA
jgi:hypothetical protein